MIRELIQTERELLDYIDLPEVYLLSWSENGKIVHCNWCHQSAADKEKVKGI